MDFSRFDIVLLTTMTLAIIVMSLTLPALGLADQSDEQTEDDIPEFNLTQDRFDFSTEQPNKVSVPGKGVMNYSETRSGTPEGIELFWIDRPKDTGTSIQPVNTSSGQLEIWFRNWSGTGNKISGDEYAVNSEDQTIIHDNDSWTIEFEVRNLTNVQKSNMTADIFFDVKSTPNNAQGPFGFGALDDLANVLAFIAQAITWGVSTFAEAGANVIVMVFEISKYIISLMHWMLSTYFAVISAAPSFASVILMVPGVLLFAEFAKLGLLFTSILR